MVRRSSVATVGAATRETGGASPALACGQEARENRVAPHRLQPLRPASSPPSPGRGPSPSPAGWRACPCRSSASAPSCSSRARPAATAWPAPSPARWRSSVRWPARSGRGPWTGAGRASSCRSSSRATCLRRRVRRRRRPRRAYLVVVRPRRAVRRCAGRTSARWCGPAGRTRSTAERRQTAFAFESVVDEVVFVVGPPLVTFLATLINPPVGFLTGSRDRLRRRPCGCPGCARPSRPCT